MPKRKRNRKAVQTRTSSLVVKAEDLSGSDMDEEADDLEFLQDSLAEGRAAFLKKMRL